MTRLVRLARQHLFRRDARIALLVSIVTLLLLFPYLQVNLPRLRDPAGGVYAYDEGTFLYHCWRISLGHVIYRDFFDFKGIVAYLPTALVYGIVGPSFVAGRVTQFVVVTALAALLYVNTVALTGYRFIAIVAALFVPLIVWPAWPSAYHDLLAQVFLIGGVGLALRALPSHTHAWLGVGVCCALAFWTSLAQGTAGLVALPAAGILIQARRRAWRRAWQLLRWFGLGVAIVTAPILIYALATGSLLAMLRAVFVFPFSSYGSVNATSYAFDLPGWVESWRGKSSELAFGARVTGTALAAILPIAVVLALGALVAALVSLRKGPASSEPTPFDRLLLVCSLAAAGMPVLLSSTRSDLAHIGFVAPGCVLVVLGVAALPVAGLRYRGALLVPQALLATAMTVSVVVASWFHLRNVTSGYVQRPLLKLERLARTDFDVDSDMKLLRPDDYTVHLPAGYLPGGFSYLLSQRHNASSFTILEDDGKYYADQWPRAADEIVARRPRLMKVTQADLNKLARYRPEIRTMYFGYDGRYMLDARRPGPVVPSGSEWAYEVSSGGKPVHTGHATIQVNGAILTVTMRTSSQTIGPLRGSLDEDRLAIFHSHLVYAAQLSPDGKNAAGRVYDSASANDPAATFTLKRVEPIAAQTAGK